MEWGYRRVRQLLRKLRTPGAIQDDELARALCTLTASASVRDAVLLLAERALRGFPPVYWTIVRRVDVDGESSQAVADEIHLSERSFFRYRAAAIAAVAAEIDAVTRSAPPKRSENLDVLALVARGRYLWKHRTTAALQRAARYFERALELDPTFARAYAGMADVHLLMGEYLVRDPIEAFHEANVAVERAMEIDPTLPELHATLADLHLFSRKDLRRAKESFDLALSIDPTYSTAHHFAAWHAMINDDLPAAMDHLRVALGFAPDALELQTTLGIVHLLEGAPEQGLRHLAEVLELDPEFSFARYQLAHGLAGLGRVDEALDHLEVLTAAEPRESYAAMTAYASARGGDPRPARRFLDRGAGPRRRPHHYLRAYAQLGLGQRAEAIGELRAAVEYNEPWTILLPLDGIFKDLRSDRAFRTLLPLAITAR
ncbi:MAG: transcriptional regulator, CadC [Candidatus Eremiobacteraeota bacterium]|nr:transcriptional regulator, CadC [Candidatus Eremiobacteraeota bacterium]